jgi:hypothetical protein
MLGGLIIPVLARNLMIKKYYFVAWCGDGYSILCDAFSG